MKIDFRKASIEDVGIYYHWANDDLVRKNSYEQQKISFEDHIDWFKKKLSSSDCFFYLFLTDQTPVGQVRIENKTDETVIGISIDSKFRGQGLGARMLEMACKDYLTKFPQTKIFAYIKENNIPSYKIFKEAEFGNDQSIVVDGIKSIKLSKNRK